MTQNPAIDPEVLLAQSGWMRQLALGLLDDPQGAEDVVQETWLRALRSPPRGAGEIHTLRRWLRTVARRIALRRLESDAARRRREAEVARSERDLDSEMVAERLRLQRTLAAHVLELSEPLRTAVLLRFQEGLSPTDLASRLGISNEAGRQRVSRGIAELRHRLDRESKDRAAWNRTLALLAVPPGFLQPATHVGLLVGTKWALAALVVSAIVWAGWRIGSPEDRRPDPKPSRGAASADPSPQAGEHKAPEHRSPLRDAEVGLLATVDRQRDLHGRVVDRLGSAVAGALVEATLPNRSTHSLISGLQNPIPSLNVRARTNPRGEFKLRVPRRGMVDVEVTADAFASTTLPDRRPGEKLLVRLVPSCTIRGKVTHFAGHAAVGVRLRLDRDHSRSVFREIGSMVTDSAGTYRFDGVRPGRFALRLVTPSGNYMSTVIEVGDGGRVDHDIEISPGRRVRGVVEDETGRRVAGASVIAQRAYLRSREEGGMAVGPATIGLRWWGDVPTRTDARGEFEIEVPVGILRSQLIVTATGFARHQVLLDENDGEVNVKLRAGYSVRGRCMTADGHPVRGAEVSALAQAHDGSMVHGDFASTRSDRDGRFALVHLRPDVRHAVAIQEPGFGDVVYMLDRGAGGPRDLGDIVLHVAGTVSGTVVAPDGTPQVGHYVFCTGGRLVDRFTAMDDDDVIRGLPGLGRRNHRTDDLGRFRIDGLSPGDYAIYVTGQGSEDGTRFQVEAGEHRKGVRIVVSALEIGGRVTDSQGHPIGQAGVLLLSTTPPRRRLTVTSVDGRFRFRAVPLGAYAVRVAPNSIHTRHGNQMVHSVERPGITAGERNIAIILPPAAVTSGVVIDDAGKPLRRGIVFARNAAGKVVTYEATNDEGEFLLRLPPGAIVDLYIGPDSKLAVAKGIRAGRRNLRITATHGR